MRQMYTCDSFRSIVCVIPDSQPVTLSFPVNSRSFFSSLGLPPEFAAATRHSASFASVKVLNMGDSDTLTFTYLNKLILVTAPVHQLLGDLKGFVERQYSTFKAKTPKKTITEWVMLIRIWEHIRSLGAFMCKFCQLQRLSSTQAERGIVNSKR
ncbi:hypothetical protein LXL04_033043 [Taraxacum kok-saghyz]